MYICTHVFSFNFLKIDFYATLLLLLRAIETEKKKGRSRFKKKVIAIFLRPSESTHIAANTKRIQFPSDFRRADELMIFEP